MATENYLRARYILVDRKPVLEPDHDAWQEWMESSGEELRLFHAQLFTPARQIDVSTWFLGFCHHRSVRRGWGAHRGRHCEPYLFCTMVTLMSRDDVAPVPRYCSSWEAAERTHELVVTRLKGPNRGVGRSGWLGGFPYLKLGRRRSI